MEIKPVDLTVKTLLESAFYVVPRFQRPYSWDRENVADFWNDAIASDDLDYFIGSFVVYRATPTSDTLLIVDGQQRITTITLLLASIRNAFAKEGHNELAKGMQQLIERKDINHDERYVLLSESPYPFLQEHIQKLGPPDLNSELGSEEESLKTAFEYLTAQIESTLGAISNDASLSDEKKAAKRKAKLIDIRDRVLRLQLISIQLNSEDDAYLIFETLNTRGKDLRVSDLVKNHLTRTIRTKNKGVDAPRDKWDEIRAHLDESSAEIDINRFLHHSWVSRHPYLPEKKLFKEIKRKIDRTQAATYLDQLLSDSRLYREILEPTSSKWKKEQSQICESLKALVLFHVVQPVPMLLSILRAYDSGRLSLKQTRDVLQSMEHFHFQFSAITSQRTGGGTGQMFAVAARELNDARTKDASDKTIKHFVKKLRERLPSPAEFRAALAEVNFTDENTKQRSIVRYLLMRIDVHSRKHGAVDYSKLTIEHVSPLHPLVGTPPANVGRVGNLLLVPGTLNSDELRNKPFLEKRALYERYDVPVDAEIASATDWGSGQIEQRTAALASLLQGEIFRV